jgi:hypothetical protein
MLDWKDFSTKTRIEHIVMFDGGWAKVYKSKNSDGVWPIFHSVYIFYCGENYFDEAVTAEQGKNISYNKLVELGIIKETENA